MKWPMWFFVVLTGCGVDLRAQLVMVNATGHFTQILDAGGPGLPVGLGVGTTFALNLIYDSTIPSGGSYVQSPIPPSKFEIDAGPYVYLAGNSFYQSVSVASGSGSPNSYSYLFAACPCLNLANNIGMAQGLFLTGPTGLFPNTGHLPNTIPPLSAYTTAGVQLSFFNTATGGGVTFLNGVIDTLTSSTGCGANASVPCITTPSDGAFPASSYVALSGTGTPGATLNIIKDGAPVGAVIVDADGTWESVADVGSGPHTIRVSDAANSASVSPPVNITNVGTFGLPLVPPSTFEKMRTADIVLTHGQHSIQTTLYGPQYTHAALFMGGDRNGTPLIGEAVPSGEAGSFPQVRELPLESSTVFTDGVQVDFFRPITSLGAAERTAIVSAAAGYASRGLQYWDISLDLLAPWGNAWFWWDDILHMPRLGYTARFNQAKAYMLAKKNLTTRFICSTLVWRSYLDGTGGTVDISTPNNLAITGGKLQKYFDPAFVKAVSPDFVFPDTIALNTSVVYKVP